MMGPMAGPPPPSMPLPPGLGGVGPGGPPGAGPGGPGPGDESDESAAWQDVVDALKHAMEVEKDPADKAMASKMLAMAHKLQADRDNEVQQAAGVASPALKLALRQNR